MRLNDIILDEQQLDEKPMGFLKKAGLGIASKFSDKAQGAKEAGEEANFLKKEFMKFAGGTGQEITPKMVLQWLVKNGYPTDGAKRAIEKVSGAQKVGQSLGKAAGAVGKAASTAAKTVGDVAKGAAAGAKAATAQPKAAAPAPQAKAPVTPPSAGVNVKGLGAKKPQATKQVASTDFSDMDALTEGLSGSQLDDIFMAAARDAIAVDGGQSRSYDTDFDDNKAAASGLGALAKGAKQGAQGEKAIPKEIADQLAQLNPRQKMQLNKMIGMGI